MAKEFRVRWMDTSIASVRTRVHKVKKTAVLDLEHLKTMHDTEWAEMSERDVSEWRDTTTRQEEAAS